MAIPRWAWLAVLALVHVPYVYEVIAQTIVQARLLRALPPDVRARLPPHPPPERLFFASTAFFSAFLKLLFTDEPGDSPEVERHKKRLRVSLHREVRLSMASLIVLGAVACCSLAFG
jgi:hypothetical protein